MIESQAMDNVKKVKKMKNNKLKTRKLKFINSSVVSNESTVNKKLTAICDGKVNSSKKMKSNKTSISSTAAKITTMSTKSAPVNCQPGLEKGTEEIQNGQDLKKKKRHKKKPKTNGLSNWAKLCSTTLHINPSIRKTHPLKRVHEPEETETEAVNEPKRQKPEVWFDNVDEIFLEGPPSPEPVPKLSLKPTPKPKQKPKPKPDVSDKLVKPDCFSGLTNCVAMDCEMVGIGPEGEESILARVSLVNHFGVCLYDKFVLPREKVTDYRTFVSGVTEENLATGEEFSKVQKEVSDILRGRILVGHAVHNDLKVLYLTHPHSDIRDTSRYKPFRDLFGGRNPALKKLSEKLLSVQVQEGEHSSVQDAQATMRLYTMFRQRWEKELKAKVKRGKRNRAKKKKKQKQPAVSSS